MISRPLLLISLVAVFLGCNKETDSLFPDPLNPNQSTFKSTLFIEITDAEGKPLGEVNVRIGHVERKTDYKGFLYLGDTPVGESAYLIAEKEGYFQASRRFYPTENKSHYVKIIMLSNSRSAFFTSSDGLVATVDDVTINLPKNVYEYENGGAYEGVVLLAMQAIAADDPDLSFKMPGDLTGVKQDGLTGGLASMGMVAVELRTPTGEKLQLKKDADVEIRMKVPEAMLATAPSKIPMWYFDEESGIWREEGEATLIADMYTATVHHFSFWNCDDWFPIIDWSASFNYPSRSAAVQVKVCITIINLNTTVCEYTNEEGVVSGMVAANELMQMDVINGCDEVVYSAQIGPYAEATFMGPITISSLDLSHISGIALNCAREPVTNGYVVINNSDHAYYQILDPKTGAFSSDIYNCNSGKVSVIAVDADKLNFSPPEEFPYALSIDADTLIVCQNIEEHFVIDVEGFAEQFILDSVKYRFTEDHISLIASEDSLANRIFLYFEGKKPGSYPEVSCILRLTVGPQSLIHCYNADLVITNFGEVGGYVQGYLSGELIHSDPGNGSKYGFTGNFSVFRTE